MPNLRAASRMRSLTCARAPSGSSVWSKRARAFLTWLASKIGNFHVDGFSGSGTYAKSEAGCSWPSTDAVCMLGCLVRLLVVRGWSPCPVWRSAIDVFPDLSGLEVDGLLHCDHRRRAIVDVV